MSKNWHRVFSHWNSWEGDNPTLWDNVNKLKDKEYMDLRKSVDDFVKKNKELFILGDIFVFSVPDIKTRLQIGYKSFKHYEKKCKNKK